jgi:hypothetical protein
MPSQMDAAREAIQRRGLRAYRTRGMPEPERHNTSISPMNTAVDAAERYVEHIERAIADKAVRLWVLS